MTRIYLHTKDLELFGSAHLSNRTYNAHKLADGTYLVALKVEDPQHVRFKLTNHPAVKGVPISVLPTIRSGSGVHPTTDASMRHHFEHTDNHPEGAKTVSATLTAKKTLTTQDVLEAIFTWIPEAAFMPDHVD